MSIREQIAAGKYNNKVPYPDRKLPAQELHSKLKAYHAGADVARAEFRVDLESEYHMSHHPKADKLWNLAWEHGHSSGLVDVVHYYEDFLELITPEDHQNVYLVERAAEGNHLEPVAICSTAEKASEMEDTIVQLTQQAFSGVIITIEIDKPYVEGVGVCDHRHVD